MFSIAQIATAYKKNVNNSNYIIAGMPACSIETSDPESILGSAGPDPRRIQPLSAGKIVAFPEVGGLHYRYERWAA
jgi:hypothetical protein